MAGFDQFGGGFDDDDDVAMQTDDSNEPTSDLEVYAKEVMAALINDNLPPTPYNYSVYFDRLLEDKSETLRKEVNTILEFEDSSDSERAIEHEHNLKQGFGSIKNILQITATIYKNTNLMTKILGKRKSELTHNLEHQSTLNIVYELEDDITKLGKIFKKQIDTMKVHYDETASVVKTVESETIFDNQYGIYNKRYLITKLGQEIKQIKEFKHNSCLIMLMLSKSLQKQADHPKIISMMTKTIARLLMKTSRRSDIVAHYGDGVFSMMLKHTDLESAEKASERMIDMVASSNFFLADKEYQLKISVGIANIVAVNTAEEIVSCALDAMDEAENNDSKDYAICNK
jgi:diguanylate cyclase (GGDEF)-like protein